MPLTNAFIALMAAISVPMMIVNFGAVPVAGIALAIEGHWKLIFLGIGAAVILPFVYVIAALPTMALAFFVDWISKRRRVGAVLGKVLSFPLAVVNLIYSTALIWAIIGAVFWFLPALGGISPQDTAEGPAGLVSAYYEWEIMLWCYSTATAPFSYMASKEDSGHLTSLNALFFAHLCALIYFVSGLFYLSVASLNWTMLAWFGSAVIIQVSMAFEALLAKKAPLDVE